jgi:UDP-2,3-diacylglucosamine pyrophosphatase LpxH
LFFAALQYYDRRKFTYIELGDGDELWENRNLQEIIRTHSNQFWIMSEFYRDGRFYMLYGNHDRKKERDGFCQANCHSYFCESEGRCRDLFPGLKAWEAIRLQDCCHHYEILLVHGHQGDFWNDTVWRLSRFLVRYVWRPLELMGCNDPTSAAKNYKKKEKTEKRLAEWANAHGTILVAGHTHRSVFPEPGKGYYFNDGSCVHPRCVTALEIEQGGISLVKWSSKVREDNVVYIGRDVLAGPARIENYAKG